MNNDYKLTVIMPTYNQEKYLKQSIDSVLMQKTNFRFQLLITDDCSTEIETIDVLRNYAEKYPDKIKVLFNDTNIGAYKNYLRGEAITKTPYFMILDADDYLTDENYFQKAVDFLDNNSEFTIYSTNLLYLFEDGSTRKYIKKPVKVLDSTFEDYLHDKCIIPQTLGMVFRNVIFINGVPQELIDAPDNDKINALGADRFRFVMHLHEGKAHYVNEISGVYRILKKEGIYSSTSSFEKYVCEANAYVEFNKFFRNEYNKFYMNNAYKALKKSLMEYSLNLETMETEIPDYLFDLLQKVTNECNKNKDIIDKKVNFKNRLDNFLFYKLYKFCVKKMIKRGIL